MEFVDGIFNNAICGGFAVVGMSLAKNIFFISIFQQNNLRRDVPNRASVVMTA
jgi:hypothetical protein